MVVGRGTAQLAADNSVFPLRRKSLSSQESLPIGTRVGAGVRKELDSALHGPGPGTSRGRASGAADALASPLGDNSDPQGGCKGSRGRSPDPGSQESLLL